MVEEQHAEGRHPSTRIDLHLRIPKDFRGIEIDLVNGEIIGRALNGDFRFAVVNGDIELENLSGDGQVTSVNGEIKATFTALRKTGHVELTDTNGNIFLKFNQAAAAHVSAGTVIGNLTTDAGEKAVTAAGESLETDLANRGNVVKAQTVKGDIVVDIE